MFKYIITYNESAKFSSNNNWPPVKLYPSDSPVEVEMNHPRNINQDKGRWSGSKKMKKRPAISISQDAPSESNLRVRVRNNFLKLHSIIIIIIGKGQTQKSFLQSLQLLLLHPQVSINDASLNTIRIEQAGVK